MDYLDSRLTRPVRRTIMGLLFLAFFIIAPLVILYTVGYRYDISAGEIKRTGVINVDVEPSSATVYLNDVRLDKSMPIRLPNRAPGVYDIRIEADGHKTWHKDLTVESGKTTYIRDLTLFADALPTSLFEYTEDETTASLSPAGGTAVLITRTATAQEVELFDIATQSRSSLQRLPLGNTVTISWSPFHNAFLIQEISAQSRLLSLVDAATGTQLAQRTLVTTAAPNIQWSDGISPTLSVQDGNALLTLSATGQSVQTETLGSDIWFVEDNGDLWEFDEDDRTIRNNGEAFSVPTSLEHIIDISARRAIVQIPDAILVLTRDGDETKTTRIDASKTVHNQLRNEWLAWSPWELTLIGEDGNTEVLNRTSEGITTVLPLDEFGILLLATETSLSGFTPDFFLTQELFAGGTIESIAADTEQRMIYFWGTVGSRSGLFELAY